MTAEPDDSCEHRDDELVPMGTADGRPCGVCGRLLYPMSYLLECQEPGCHRSPLAVSVETQWIGDGWTISSPDREAGMVTYRSHMSDVHGVQV